VAKAVAKIGTIDFRKLTDAITDAGLAVKGLASDPDLHPLQFECLEPFRRWKMRFRGNAVETTVAPQMRGVTTGPSRQVEIELDAEMAVPPWVQGTMSSDARNMP